MFVLQHSAILSALEPHPQALELLLLLKAFHTALKLNSLLNLSLSYEYCSPLGSIECHAVSVDGVAVLVLRYGVLLGLEENNIYKNNASWFESFLLSLLYGNVCGLRRIVLG